MREQDYARLFKQLGIEVKPLPPNYDPESFGKELMTGFYEEQGVLYSATTSLRQKNEEKDLCECK